MINSSLHLPVMLEQSLQLLNIDPNGIYIDGTFGRGGHSKAILQQLTQAGKLIAFDQDQAAVQYARDNISDPRFHIFHDNFINYQRYLQDLLIEQVNGILLDLGICSTQVDDSDRGFSFMRNSALDMRMNNTTGITAAQWLNTASVQEISEVLWFYGEERFSKKIALAIYNARGALQTTYDLANLIKASIPYCDKHKHPATRSFQAIRIFINDELNALDQMMAQAPQILAPKGRLVVISFHSLEDRIVKRKFQEWSQKQEYLITAKKIKPLPAEIVRNQRSRSAIMRALERKS